MVVQLNRTEVTPGVGDYDINQKKHTNKAKSFNTTQPRFDKNHIMGRTLELTPGVGDYNLSNSFNDPRYHPERTKNRRFSSGVNNYREMYTPKDIGPGSYNIDRGIGKKSFNVIYTKKYGGRPIKKAEN